MGAVAAPRAGLVACLIGLALASAVQVAGPLPGPPLYDGVVSVEPYVYLQPSGTQPGGPRGATARLPVVNASSPVVALGTPENPPQAQLIAAAGALLVPSGSTDLVVSITPVPPAAQPTSGTIDGNVYRVSVVNQAGAAVQPDPGEQVTIALRDPGSFDLVTMELLAGGTWQPLPTVSAPVAGAYLTTGLATFGDFALVGSGSSGGGGAIGFASPFALVTALAVVLVLLVLGIRFLRDRPGRPRGAP